jgi:hypothetical protein
MPVEVLWVYYTAVVLRSLSVVRSGGKGLYAKAEVGFKVVFKSKILGLVGYAAYIVVSVG